MYGISLLVYLGLKAVAEEPLRDEAKGPSSYKAHNQSPQRKSFLCSTSTTPMLVQAFQGGGHFFI